MVRSGSVDYDYHVNMSEECVVLAIKVQPQLLVTGRILDQWYESW